MHTFYLISVMVHILSAVVWLGGMAFLVLVLVPIIRQATYKELAFSFIHQTGLQFRRVGWVCLFLLFFTGSFNLAYRGYGWEAIVTGNLWQGGFGYALGIKLFFYAMILGLSAVHDFVIGPKATELGQQQANSEIALKFRKQARWMGRINLLLALGVVFMGIILVRGWPQ